MKLQKLLPGMVLSTAFASSPLKNEHMLQSKEAVAQFQNCQQKLKTCIEIRNEMTYFCITTHIGIRPSTANDKKNLYKLEEIDFQNSYDGSLEIGNIYCVNSLKECEHNAKIDSLEFLVSDTVSTAATIYAFATGII